MLSALIVGGAGFVGSHLAGLLRQQGHSVWVFDDLSVGRRSLLKSLDADRFIQGDILKAAAVRNAMQKAQADVVYHLAAVHHIPTCEQKPEIALRTNVEGTQIILTACAELKVKRIVFTSSGAVYDMAAGPLTETAALSARDVYGISKLAGEHLLARHRMNYQGEAIVARLFNCVGRRETNNHLIPDILAQLVKGKRQIRLGNLESRRDYVHVEDAAAAFAALADAPVGDKIEVFNIASGLEHSVLDLVNLLGEIIGEPIEAVSVPELRRKVDRPGQLGDIRKLQALTSWRPRRTLKQALKEAWENCAEMPVLSNY